MNHLDLEIGALRRLATQTRSAASRMTWRRAMQRRMIRVSSILGMLPKIVPGLTVSREKTNGAWVVSVRQVAVPTTVMTIETRTPGRTLDDLAAPLVARVLRPDLVDVHLLARLESRGLIRVVMAETN